MERTLDNTLHSKRPSVPHLSPPSEGLGGGLFSKVTSSVDYTGLLKHHEKHKLLGLVGLMFVLFEYLFHKQFFFPPRSHAAASTQSSGDCIRGEIQNKVIG